ncbi:Transposase family Tnp2 protein [Ceratobasidium sp. AG-Ba]|nr:Transposase family Tnp2 protein [Ceratobasidium sp. AG-Ba]
MPEDWMDRINLEDRFSEISQAWGWRSQSTGLQRAWNGEAYEDEPSGYEPLALSRLPYGLSLGLNMDGVYITANNLPFQLRMLIENMILAIVIPGPNEPKGYALDQILEPLVNDLIEMSNGFNLRDPYEHLQAKYRWLNAPEEEREEIREQTGTVFVDFDRIPGFYSFDNCPIDAMHLFDLGITPSIVKDILYKCGMFRKRYPQQPPEETPEARFNAFVQRTYFPPHSLFEAWRVGDTIPDQNIPRGGRNTKHFKAQQLSANQLLRRRRHAHNADDGDAENIPQIDDCASSRNPRDYMTCIMRYCIATHELSQHQITRQSVADMSALLELVGVGFARMNVHLPPSFHKATHIGSHILKHGNVSGTSLNRFEQANRVLIKINTNGHGSGVLETTMAKGWMRRAKSHRYVKLLQSIENPTEDDILTLDVLLRATKNSPENDLQRGMLDAILGGEAPVHGLEPIRLANRPARVDFRSDPHAQYYEPMIQYCNDHNLFEGVVFYGFGREPEGGVHIPLNNSTLSYPNFYRYGVRYGSANHVWGYRARYGYIEDHIPVIIQGIYESSIYVHGQEHKFVAVMVQRFVEPEQEPMFLWNYWADFTGMHAWPFEELGPLEAVPADAFSGVFTLSDLAMSYGHYWITCEMANTLPANRANDLN